MLHPPLPPFAAGAGIVPAWAHWVVPAGLRDTCGGVPRPAPRNRGAVQGVEPLRVKRLKRGRKWAPEVLDVSTDTPLRPTSPVPKTEPFCIRGGRTFLGPVLQCVAGAQLPRLQWQCLCGPSEASGERDMCVYVRPVWGKSSSGGQRQVPQIPSRIPMGSGL